MIRKLFSGFALLALVAGLFAIAPAQATHSWDLTGSYDLPLVCTSGCSGTFPHTMNITSSNTTTGAFSGTGFYNADPSTTWTVAGTATGSAVTFAIDYDASDYALSATGTINPDGSITGNATGPGQTFSFTTSAEATQTTPAQPTHVFPTNGDTLTQAEMTHADWTDVAGATSYYYQSSLSSATNPDGSFTTPAYTSNPLALSEIPTPGTPEGTYFWHVRAIDVDDNSSDWTDPWTFTVDNTPPPADTVQVHITKYLDGQPATDVSANNTSFGMNVAWNDDGAGGIGSGNGTFTLDSTNNYATSTIEFQQGVDYSFNEIMDSQVAANCDGDEPYALAGYSTGDSLAEAAAAPTSTTTPNFTDLQEDQFAIVRNVICPDVADDGNVQVTIVKYLDGQMATSVTADNASFSMSSSWSDEAPGGIGTGNGGFTLDSNNNYTASTSVMQDGADYSVNENFTNDVAANCDGDETYALEGYSTGDTLVGATQGPTSTTSPSFTDLEDDKFVIVRNISCDAPTVPADTVQVHITKYLDGQPATDVTADNTTFTMDVAWNDDGAGGIGSGNGTFTLDPNNDYSTSTIEFQQGVDYSFSEAMNDQVAANCDGDEPYALAGYSTGDTLVEAIAADSTTTAPSFTDLQSDRYVLVRNVICPDVVNDGTVQVTIVKYLNGQVATAATTGGDSFQMQSSWSNAGTMSDGTGTYTLGTSGFNNPTAYYATTAEMNVGANYNTNELFENGVAAGCSEAGAEYALVGYSVGDTQGDAATAATVTSAPSLTNLQEDQFIIVRNVRCGDVLGAQDIVCEDAPIAMTSSSNTLFRGLTTTTPTNMSDGSQYSSANTTAVTADSTGFPGAWNGISSNANLSGAIWVSNSATQPSGTDEGNGLGSQTSYRLFSHTFTVPSNATNISPTDLYFAADNAVTVFLNDVQLATTAFDSVGQVTLPTLVAGQTYTLEFAVRNDGLSNEDNPSDGDYNPTGLIYKLIVDFDCTVDNNNGGGGSSSGSRGSNNNNGGQVLGDTDFGPGLQMLTGSLVFGDSTTIPFDAGGNSEGRGRVLGDSDRLPVTGTTSNIVWALIAIAGVLMLSKTVATKMQESRLS